MARRSSIRPLQELNEINMTPLIDLTFLLLITFIITMPMVEQGIPVNLPKGKAKDLDQSETRSITIDGTGGLFLDQAVITLEQLGAEMKALSASDPETTVLVRADDKLAYGRVVEVMRILNEAQITRMALVTTPDGPAPR
jgi:biopolymer transport protein ExbD